MAKLKRTIFMAPVRSAGFSPYDLDAHLLKKRAKARTTNLRHYSLRSLSASGGLHFALVLEAALPLGLRLGLSIEVIFRPSGRMNH
jgi:hypothetical protein